VSTYLDYDTFRALTTIPESFVDDIEKRQPGWVDLQLEHGARWIDARLRKRYATPFAAFDESPDPTPPTVQGWLARLVTVRVMIRRGVDPNDLQFELIRDDADKAEAELLEAANSDEGWFDLPLRVDENGSAITQGNPRYYSEASPYVYTDLQLETGRNEDESGVGSSG
jgi:hypothetical protein